LPTPFAPAIAFPAAVGKLGPVNGHHRPTDGRDRLRRGADGYQCPALFALVRREFRFGVWRAVARRLACRTQAAACRRPG